MPIFELNSKLIFPPVELSEPDGLLASGGDLSIDRLLLAYKNGIFPWYENSDILWWSPDPRFVLFPPRLKISKSMSSLIRKNAFEFTTDQAFAQVIDQCGNINRKNQDGTWITDAIRKSYTALHGLGYAHSAEAWQNGRLVGGLYGVRLGNNFFGESMFSTVSNASKFAFIRYVQQLIAEGVTLIDCQVYTSHLESLGAEMIPRKLFIRLIKNT